VSGEQTGRFNDGPFAMHPMRLNPIEPRWVHAKKAVVEPDGLLSVQQLAERICAHFGCSYEPHLAIVEKVS